jgi:hypothetical protein
LLVSPELENAKPGTSDLGAYWRAELPAVLWAAAYEQGFVNPGYHLSSDTLANINWNYYRRMSEVAVQMVAYASRMSLKDDKAVSEQGWQILGEQEDRSQSLATFTVPKAADRELSLASSDRYKSGVMDFSDGPSDSDSESDDRKPYGIDKPKRKKGGTKEKYEEFPLYVARFIENIENARPDDIFMFILPKKKAAGSSVSNPVMLNRGFVSAGPLLLDLTNDNDEVYALIKQKVKERGGRMFTVTPVSFKLADLMNSDVWSAVRLKIGSVHESLVVDIPGEGRYLIQRLNQDLDSSPSPAAKTKVKVKAKTKVKAPKLKVNNDNSIWREE